MPRVGATSCTIVHDSRVNGGMYEHSNTPRTRPACAPSLYPPCAISSASAHRSRRRQTRRLPSVGSASSHTLVRASLVYTYREIWNKCPPRPKYVYPPLLAGNALSVPPLSVPPLREPQAKTKKITENTVENASFSFRNRDSLRLPGWNFFPSHTASAQTF